MCLIVAVRNRPVLAISLLVWTALSTESDRFKTGKGKVALEEMNRQVASPVPATGLCILSLGMRCGFRREKNEHMD